MTRRVLFLCFLLAAALFVRAVLPQGYMPDRFDGASIAVVVCGSGGVHRITIGDDEDRGEDRQRAEAPCAFAGLVAPAIPARLLAVLGLPAPAVLVHAEQALIAAPMAAPRLHPPATGPPLPA